MQTNIIKMAIIKKMSKKLNKADLDGELAKFKEKLRQYCQKRLRSEPNRKKAAKTVGYEFSYLSAALAQRGKGGFEFWFKLLYYCLALEIDGIDEKLEAFFSLDQPFQSFTNLSEADIIFKDLSEIPIVNEEAKYQLATSLRDMLLDLNDNVTKRLRREGKLK